MRALLVAIVIAAGCGAGHPPQPGSVTLGTSALDGTGFFPLDGDQPLVAGSQGGFHVWLKYRVSGMSPGHVLVHRTARRISDDRLLLTADGTQDLGEPAGGYWEVPHAIPSFMCPSPLGVNIIDAPTVFDITIRADDGTLLGETTAEATPHCPTGDQAAFCQRICSGN